MKRLSFLSFLAAVLLGSTAMVKAADEDSKKEAGVPASYPLKTCVVSDEPFGGEMGKAVKVTHEGTDIYLCCKSCMKEFKKDPAKYAKMVKDAPAKK